MKKEFYYGMAAGVFCAAIVAVSGYLGYRSRLPQGENVLSNPTHVSKLLTLEGLVDDCYLYEKDEEVLAEGLYAGLIAALGDPYSCYYTPEQYTQEKTVSQGTYVGIGAVLVQQEDGSILVVECYDGGSAQAAGLQAQDVVIQVDGEAAADQSLREIVSRIRGGEQSQTVFLVTREGEDTPLEITIPITEIQLPSVSYELLEEGVGYLQVNEFKGVTYEQFTEAYQDLTDQGMESLIIDLRDNPGGYLDVACDMLREILPEGIIVYSEDKAGNRQEELCAGDHVIEVPLVVLVNQNSASASEVFAGAVQDYGVGTIVGTVTYGKGVVQIIRTFEDGSAVKLTTSHYYTPNGNDIHGVGILPDVEVEDSDEEIDLQLEEALRILREEKAKD